MSGERKKSFTWASTEAERDALIKLGWELVGHPFAPPARPRRIHAPFEGVLMIRSAEGATLPRASPP